MIHEVKPAKQIIDEMVSDAAERMQAGAASVKAQNKAKL
jgi:hypothetical protein